MTNMAKAAYVAFPANYQWLRTMGVAAPNTIEQALALFGTVEGPGDATNPTILKWAKECGLDRVYGRNDSVPWCGLFASVVVRRAGWVAPENPLWALNWRNFGTGAPEPSLGDVMVFRRDRAGHVAFYVGEDADSWHILGGNQHDQVCFVRWPKDATFVGAQRPIWKHFAPETRKPYWLHQDGSLDKTKR